MTRTRSVPRAHLVAATLATLALALAACTSASSSTSPYAIASSAGAEPPASQAPASQTPIASPTHTASPTPIASPTHTAAPASPVAAARCAETPDAAPSATVQWNIPVVGGEPTIKAGQAVEFVTTGLSPTVTEGTNGKPAASACIDKTIGSAAATMSVVVTFYQPGDYSITCRKVPETMHTVVHVK